MSHLHRYKRINLGKKKFDKATKKWHRNDYIVFKCQKLGCKTFKVPQLIIGEVAECGLCNSPFEVTRKALLLAIPHCTSCTKDTLTEKISPALDLLEEIMHGNDEG